MVLEDPWHSHLLQTIWRWICHYLVCHDSGSNPNLLYARWMIYPISHHSNNEKKWSELKFHDLFWMFNVYLSLQMNLCGRSTPQGWEHLPMLHQSNWREQCTITRYFTCKDETNKLASLTANFDIQVFFKIFFTEWCL